MSTRADFYVGRGASAEYLGSLSGLGHPLGSLCRTLPRACDEQAFRRAVGDLLDVAAAHTRGGVPWPLDARPRGRWPWPWSSSSLTDYAYAWDGGRAHVSSWGGGWSDLERYDTDYPFNVASGAAPRAVFPVMGGAA